MIILEKEVDRFIDGVIFYKDGTISFMSEIITTLTESEVSELNKIQSKC